MLLLYLITSGSAVAAKSGQTPIAPTTPQPTSTPDESLITSSSDFKTITLKCREKPAGKYIDLEFRDCWWGRAESKNYSTSWYESSIDDNKIQLIGSGGELSVELPPRSNSSSSSSDEAPIYKLRVRRLTSEPLRTITVNCADKTRIIWGIAIIPKCTSSGSYIDLKTGRDLKTGQGNANHYPIIVKTANGSPMHFSNNTFSAQRWYVTSAARQVTLTFSASR